MIEALKAEFAVSLMCRWLGILRASYYSWCSHRESRDAKERRYQELLEKIKQLYKQSKDTYGSRRITEDLRDGGECVSRNKVAEIMRQANLKGLPKRRWKTTTDSNHALPVSPNLLVREFDVDAPDKVWVGDITYIRMGENWNYLATVIDLFNRQIVGWALEDHMRADLVIKAFEMAKRQRDIKPGLIFHSDRGSQYASVAFRKVLEGCGVVQSMSRKGNCWDNAVAESFFATIKRELLDREIWKDKQTLRSAVFEYIEVFYNRKRRHSKNGGLSPVDYEKICINYAAMAA